MHYQAALLSNLPMFAGFHPDAVQLIAFAGDQVGFARGSTIFEAGQKSDGGHLVLQGRIELFQPHRLTAPAHTVEAGGLIGEVALITPTERPVWAVAATDCLTLKITRGTVWRVLHEFPDDAAALRNTLTRRLRERLCELAFQYRAECLPTIQALPLRAHGRKAGPILALL